MRKTIAALLSITAFAGALSTVAVAAPSSSSQHASSDGWRTT